MLEAPEHLYRQMSDSRPGHRLVSLEPAALPVTMVNLSVLTQEQKPLPMVEEFTLRCLESGLKNPSEIAKFLGVATPMVEAAIVSLSSKHAIRYEPSAARLTLTSEGRELARTHRTLMPVERSFKTPFDRLTWRVADYPKEELVPKKVATDEGRVLLPAAKTRRITIDDIDVHALNDAVSRSTLRARDGMRILRARSAQSAEYRYLKCFLAVFAPKGELSDFDFGVVVQEQPSPAHEEALALAGGPATPFLRVAPESPPARPDLQGVETSAQSRDGKELTLEAITSGQVENVVRSIDMYEHRLLLAEALSTVSKRLLLVSPWVKSAVVDTGFLAALEQVLRRGVQVDIVHGIGEDDNGSDRFALERLGNLQRRFSSKFNLIRHPNTHAKLLIFDDVWVSTSFNWLSFRGDADRTYRMEEGILVRSKSHVDREYAQYIEKLRP